MLSLKIAIVLALLYLSSEAKLPKFFKICKRNSTNVSKCAEDSANYVLPRLLKRVKELNIPPFINLKIPKITARSYVPYDFNFEGNITEIDNVTYNDVVFDIGTLSGIVTFLFPKLELLGKYKIHGFVGKIPMIGEGRANVTLHDIKIRTGWTCGQFRDHGAGYFKIGAGSLISYNVSSIRYHFENLFGGDKVQGEVANQILNKYWWILAGDFVPHVPIFLMEVVYTTVIKVFANTTLDDIFSPF